MDIELVIMDWAGTTVDYGCFAPVYAFEKAFKEVGIVPTMEEIREPMGMLKKDHIRTMLAMRRIHELWLAQNGKESDETDVERIYDIFEKKLMEGLAEYTDPKEGCLECMDKLREHGISHWLNHRLHTCDDGCSREGGSGKGISSGSSGHTGGRGWKWTPEAVYDLPQYAAFTSRGCPEGHEGGRHCF